MKDEQLKHEPIALDLSALLGVNQIAKASVIQDRANVGRLLSKVGEEQLPAPSRVPVSVARLLSKIGEPSG